MQVWESDILMHEGTFLSTLTIKTILIFIPCVMPSFCAFSGARSPFVVMPFVFLNPDKMRNEICAKAHTFTVTQQSLRASEDAHIPRPVPPPGPTRHKSSGIPCSSSSLLVDALHDGEITQHGASGRGGITDHSAHGRSDRDLEVVIGAP